MGSEIGFRILVVVLGALPIALTLIAVFME